MGGTNGGGIVGGQGTGAGRLSAAGTHILSAAGTVQHQGKAELTWNQGTSSRARHATRPVPLLSTLVAYGKSAAMLTTLSGLQSMSELHSAPTAEVPYMLISSPGRQADLPVCRNVSRLPPHERVPKNPTWAEDTASQTACSSVGVRAQLQIYFGRSSEHSQAAPRAMFPGDETSSTTKSHTSNPESASAKPDHCTRSSLDDAWKPSADRSARKLLPSPLGPSGLTRRAWAFEHVGAS